MEVKYDSSISSKNELSSDMSKSVKELACAVMVNKTSATVSMEVKSTGGVIEKDQFTTSGLDDGAQKLAQQVHEQTKKELSSNGSGGDIKLEIKLERKV